MGLLLALLDPPRPPRGSGLVKLVPGSVMHDGFVVIQLSEGVDLVLGQLLKVPNCTTLHVLVTHSENRVEAETNRMRVGRSK